MNHPNNDVKQLLARVCTMLGKMVPSENMAPELLKLLLPTLVNGTKEKNGYVKANSEIALISVLRLRQGDEVQKVINNSKIFFDSVPFRRPDLKYAYIILQNSHTNKSFTEMSATVGSRCM